MRWRTVVAFCTVVVVAALVAVVVTRPGDNGPLANVEERAVVIATLPCQPSVQATSSGFVVDHETVVTVAHAIYQSRDFAVRDNTGLWHRPEILYMDLELDLAVLRVPGLAATAIPTRVAMAGEAVQMVEGAASGTAEGSVLRRVRLSIEPVGDLARTTARSGYELDIPIKGGDSGAAVVDGDENLVGFVFARSTRREASWVTSVSEVLTVLDQRGVPPWECENPSVVELNLDLPEGEPELATGEATQLEI